MSLTEIRLWSLILSVPAATRPAATGCQTGENRSVRRLAARERAAFRPGATKPTALWTWRADWRAWLWNPTKPAIWLRPAPPAPSRECSKLNAIHHSIREVGLQGYAENRSKPSANPPGRRGSQSVYTGGTPDAHRRYTGKSVVHPVYLRCASGVLSAKGRRIGRFGPK